MLQDISEVGKGAVELPAVDSLRGLAGVLEGYAEVAAAGASRLCAVNGGGSVANLQELIPYSIRASSDSGSRRQTYHFVELCCCC